AVVRTPPCAPAARRGSETAKSWFSPRYVVCGSGDSRIPHEREAANAADRLGFAPRIDIDPHRWRPGDDRGAVRPGAGPAVVLLHGADGLTYRGSVYRAMARYLSGRGMRVFLPHYFERAGTPG